MVLSFPIVYMRQQFSIEFMNALKITAMNNW